MDTNFWAFIEPVTKTKLKGEQWKLCWVVAVFLIFVEGKKVRRRLCGLLRHHRKFVWILKWFSACFVFTEADIFFNDNHVQLMQIIECSCNQCAASCFVPTALSYGQSLKFIKSDRCIQMIITKNNTLCFNIYIHIYIQILNTKIQILNFNLLWGLNIHFKILKMQRNREIIIKGNF